MGQWPVECPEYYWHVHWRTGGLLVTVSSVDPPSTDRSLDLDSEVVDVDALHNANPDYDFFLFPL